MIISLLYGPSITKLTTKYKELSKVSGLKSKIERSKVSGYRRANVAKMK